MEQCPSANTNKTFWLSLLSLQRQSTSAWSDRVLVYTCCTASRVSNPAVPRPPSLTDSPKCDGLRCPIFSPQLDMLSRFGLDNALIWTCLSRISTSDVPCQRMTAFSLRQHRATTVCVKIWVIVGLPPPPLHLLSQVASESWVWNSPCTAASGGVDFFFGVTPLWPLLHICFWPHFLPSPLISRRFNALCRGHQGRCIIDEPLDLAFVKPGWLCWLSVLLGTSKQNSARDFLTEFYPFCRRCFQASQILSSSCANGRVVLYFFAYKSFYFMAFIPQKPNCCAGRFLHFFPAASLWLWVWPCEVWVKRATVTVVFYSAPATCGWLALGLLLNV